jgi:DNA-binding transcriptional ArsR family regulator|tara:strand:+ start:252 stop:485 length:234 start_codon:yes stop_codon:yes gene_type:complete
MIGLIKSEQHYHKMNSFAALADPTRRQIIEALAQGPLSSGEIAGRFEISAPAISQHLKALRVARLVRVRVEAQWRIY